MKVETEIKEKDFSPKTMDILKTLRNMKNLLILGVIIAVFGTAHCFIEEELVNTAAVQRWQRACMNKCTLRSSFGRKGCYDSCYTTAKHIMAKARH